MMLTAVMAGIITLIAHMFMRSLWFGGGRRDGKAGALMIIGIVFAIIAPIGAALIKMAISREREFLADANGALLTRYPPGLASALRKISVDPNKLKTANQGMAHLYISNPFKKNDWFSTHPSINERIKRLKKM